ncbi:MAG TPA: carboxypeptidase-like regulatory domain-containing protein, partial [Candidatus Acidoferrales bacterium]|nr:carboxypeptidase-like regulatory domain-containing protein [Candidatus Acidoferrales bacterium]
MHRSIPRFLAAIFFSWLLAIPVLADLTGDVQGTVTDASGARVADAKITIKNLGTGATRMVTTGSEGEFSVPQLEIGEHVVTVEKDGFKAFA